MHQLEKGWEQSYFIFPQIGLVVEVLWTAKAKGYKWNSNSGLKMFVLAQNQTTLMGPTLAVKIDGQ